MLTNKNVFVNQMLNKPEVFNKKLQNLISVHNLKFYQECF